MLNCNSLHGRSSYLYYIFFFRVPSLRRARVFKLRETRNEMIYLSESVVVFESRFVYRFPYSRTERRHSQLVMCSALEIIYIAHSHWLVCAPAFPSDKLRRKHASERFRCETFEFSLTRDRDEAENIERSNQSAEFFFQLDKYRGGHR